MIYDLLYANRSWWIHCEQTKIKAETNPLKFLDERSQAKNSV